MYTVLFTTNAHCTVDYTPYGELMGDMCKGGKRMGANREFPDSHTLFSIFWSPGDSGCGECFNTIDISSRDITSRDHRWPAEFKSLVILVNCETPSLKAIVA